MTHSAPQHFTEEQHEQFMEQGYLRLGQLLDGERNTFDDGGDGVIVSADVFYDLVDESVGRTHGAGNEQGVGIGEIAIHRLPGHSDPAGDVGEPYCCSVVGDHFVDRIQNASDCLLVRGRGGTGPTATTHRLSQDFRSRTRPEVSSGRSFPERTSTEPDRRDGVQADAG